MVKKKATCYNVIFKNSFLEKSMKKSVLLSILFFIILIGCGSDANKKSVTIDEITGFIPEKASGIFTINYKKIRKYGVYKEILSDLKSEVKMKSSVVDDMSREFREELDYIVITTFNGESENDELLIMLAGNYEKDKIKSLLGKGEITKYDSVDIYKFSGKDAKGKNIEGFIAPVDGNMLLMSSSLELVQKSLDLKKANGSKNNNKELKKYIKGYGKKRRILSLAWKFPEKYRQLTRDIPFAKINLSKAEVIVAHVNYVNNVWDGIIKLVTNDPDTNSQIATTLNGIKFMGAMAGPEVEELLKRITLSSSSEAVKIHFSASDTLLKKLKKKAEMRLGKTGKKSK